MKSVKITLPEGGSRITQNARFPIRSGFSYEIEAPEIIIEGDVSLTQVTAARIPFDLEAAKAGASILQNGRAVRWLGLSDQNPTTNARNIIENEFGLAYVTDDELSMAPKKPNMRYLNMSKDQVGVQYPCSSYSYLTKKEAEEAANIADHIDWAIVGYPIIIE